MNAAREVITVIAVDLGGVVANDIWEQAFLDPASGIAATYGIPPADAEATGSRLWRRFCCSSPSRGWRQQEVDYWQECIDALKLPARVDELIALTNRFIRPIPGMLELTRELHSKVKVVICSNNTEFWYQREARSFGLDRDFTDDDVFTSCRIGAEKSHPDQAVFKTLVGRVGVRPAQVLLVDDRVSNIEAATRFGMAALLFPSHAEWGAAYLDKLLNQVIAPAPLRKDRR